MKINDWLNARTGKLDWLDMSLVKLGCMVLGVLLAAWFPALLEINPWWILGAALVLLARPAYRTFRGMFKP